jgi:putative permease
VTQKQHFSHRLLVAFVIIGALYAAGHAMQYTFSVLLFSFVLAYLFDPFVVFLEHRKVRRIYGILVLYAILCIFGLFCFTYLVPFLTLRWEALVRDLPVHVKKFQKLMTVWQSQTDLPYTAEEWNWFLDTVQSNLDALFAKLGNAVYAMAGKVALNLLNLLLAPVIAFFMLYYKPEIKAGIIRWLPPARRDFLLTIGGDINRSIGGFIRGQIIVSIIVAGLSAVPLILMDINHPLFCAIFAGLASVIPFIGVILATIPPLFFSYAEYQNLMAMAKIIGVFSVIYFLEGYVIKPIVFKESLDVNPLVTIIMVMAFGELMGFWGVILAIPIAAAIKIVSHHLRESKPVKQGG